jgi:hypothetical protein
LNHTSILFCSPSLVSVSAVSVSTGSLDGLVVSGLGSLDGGGLLGGDGTAIVVLKSVGASGVGVGKGVAAVAAIAVVVVAITGLSFPLVVAGRASVASIRRATITWEAKEKKETNCLYLFYSLNKQTSISSARATIRGAASISSDRAAITTWEK